MALDLGELSIALELENDRFRSGLGQAKRELETLPPAAQREMVKVSRVMDEEGRKSGGVVAEGMRAGLVRASPLIVAGVTGALSVGAPAVLTAATAMFAGIGIAAASQNDEVRAAFAGLRDLVKDSVDEIGQPLADVLPGIADEIGASFQRMRPQIVDTMSAIAPQVENLTGSLLGLVENALPGLSRAAQNAGPAIEGLGRFLETAGSSVGDFFSDISDHAPAAGRAFDGLGQVVEGLLPILADLLGEGAELAADVLPAVADALPVVHTGLNAVMDAASALAPVLPEIISGFVGFKAGEAAGGIVENLGGKLEEWGGTLVEAGGALEGFGGKMGKVGETMGKLAPALPILGAGIGLVTNALQANGQRVEAYTQHMIGMHAALAAGGAAAVEAEANFAHLSEMQEKYAGTFAGDQVAEATRNATDAVRKLWQEMTPLEQAQSKVAEWTETLTYRMNDESASAEDVAIAQDRLAYWTGQTEAAQGDLELALHGVTQAMIDQANQALAAIDSTFGYQNSLNQLEDAQNDVADAIAHLNDSNEETRTSTEDVERAQLALAEQSYRTALAFGQQQADMSGAGADTAEYARIVQETALQELYRLRDAAGPELAGALSQQISMLEASGVSLRGTGVQADAVRSRMEELGHSVTEVPGYHGVTIDAPTEDQRRRIEALGLKVVTLPNGRVYVSASTADAEAALAYLSRPRTAVITAVQRAVGNLNTGFSTGGPIGFADGGAVHGPGTGTSDSVVAAGPTGQPNYRLSNGEHIITAAEVRAAGGHGAVMDLRRDLLARPRRMADGGSVTATASASRVRGVREAPLVQMNGVVISNQGDAERLAQRLDYLGRLKG